jgi:hypothetical protein
LQRLIFKCQVANSFIPKCCTVLSCCQLLNR